MSKSHLSNWPRKTNICRLIYLKACGGVCEWRSWGTHFALEVWARDVTGGITILHVYRWESSIFFNICFFQNSPVWRHTRDNNTLHVYEMSLFFTLIGLNQAVSETERSMRPECDTNKLLAAIRKGDSPTVASTTK
jgi:hypothetical protein